MENSLPHDSLPVISSNIIYNHFDEVPFAVSVLKGPLLIVAYINKFNLALLKLSREQVVGKPLFEVRPDLKQNSGPIHEQVYATGERFKTNEIPIEMDIDGTAAIRYFNIVVDPIRDQSGDIVAQMATSVEVTAQVISRKRAEQQEKHYRQLADTVPIIIWMTDAKGKCTYINSRWLHITGQTEQEALGFGWLQVIHPEDQVKCRERFAAAANNADGFNLLCRVKQQNGDYRWALGRGEASYNGDGQFAGHIGSFTDVHDQIVANEKFELITKATQDAIWDWDLVTDSVYWNDAITNLFGYEEKALNGASVQWVNNIHPADRKSVVDSIHQVIDNGGKLWTHEYRFKTKNGDYKLVFDRGIVLHDADQQPVRMVGSMQDITERKLAERKTRESEQRFQAAVQAVQGVLWTNNAAGQMLGEQTGWSQLTGQTMEEYQGYGWAKAVHPDDAQASIDTWNTAVREQKTYTHEHRLKRKDGSWGIFSIRAIPLFNEDGSLREWVGVHTDITIQQNAENKLRESEEKYRQQFYELENVYRNAPIGLALIDKESRYLKINNRLAAFNGIPAEDHIGKTFRDIVPQVADQGEAILQKVLTSGEELLNMEISGETTTEPGVVHFFNESWYPIKADNGEIIAVSVVVEDITARKKAKEALETLVQERTKELQRSNQDLQQFAHVTSHDLKEPVRKILIFSRLLKDNFTLPEKANTHLSKIEKSAVRMYSMIDGVLIYSSFNAIDQRKESIDLSELANGVIDELELVITQTGASIHHRHLPVVWGYQLLLYQLFYNLLNNSLKFLVPNRPPVINIVGSTVTAAEIRSYNLNPSGKYVKITVTDNGVGFKDTEALEIFVAFTRLHSKDEFEGTGLGLALCKKIVERHGGLIWATGEVAKGAVFTIILPHADLRP